MSTKQDFFKNEKDKDNTVTFEDYVKSSTRSEPSVVCIDTDPNNSPKNKLTPSDRKKMQTILKQYGKNQWDSLFKLFREFPLVSKEFKTKDPIVVLRIMANLKEAFPHKRIGRGNFDFSSPSYFTRDDFYSLKKLYLLSSTKVEQDYYSSRMESICFYGGKI